MHGTLLPWLEERAIDAGSYWIHGGWSGRYRNGPWRWQADVLFDVPLSQDLYDYAGPAWPIRLHLALGVAHLTPPWALSFELVSSGYPDAPEDRLFTGDPMCRDVPRCKALQVDAVANDKTRMTALTSSVRRTLAERHDVVAWATVGFLQSWFAFGMGYEVQL